MTTFAEWLQQQDHRDDTVGDLARDFTAAARIGMHGHHYDTPEALLAALPRTASTEAREATEQAGNEWRATQ